MHVLDLIRASIALYGDQDFTNPIVAQQKREIVYLSVKPTSEVTLKRDYMGIPKGTKGKAVSIQEAVEGGMKPPPKDMIRSMSAAVCRDLEVSFSVFCFKTELFLSLVNFIFEHVDCFRIRS